MKELKRSGNELVGSGGICDKLDRPYRCGNGHWPNLFNDCVKAIDILEECRSWRGNVTILTDTDGSYYGLPPIYRQFADRLLDETLESHKLLRKKESTFLVLQQDRLDNYHMADSIENRKVTVEWLWSLYNVMRCVVVSDARKDDFNNLKLYAEFSHDAVAGLNPISLAEHDENVRLTIQSWEDLQRPSRLAKQRDVEEIEVTEEVDYDDDAPLQGSAAVALLGIKAAPAEVHRKGFTEDSGEGHAEVFDVGRGGRPPLAASCQANPVAPLISTVSSMRHEFSPARFLTCRSSSRVLRGQFQERRPLDFDEQYFVDIDQLCDKFNRKTRCNIGYKTLLNIFAITVLAIKHPSAAENSQE